MPQNANIGILEKWWVLRHQNPKTIDQQLKVLNEQRVAEGRSELAYLIPRQFEQEVEPNKAMGAQYEKGVEESNALRSAMYHYLFIKATDDDILQLVASDWNRSLASRLRLCRSKGGEPLWASSRDMDRLIDIMIRHREMFNVVAGDFVLHEGDMVKVKMDMFEGYEFVVTQFRGHGKGANLTLELPLFKGNLRLRTEGVFVREEYLPVQVRQLLSPEFVGQMEAGLIEVVRHRYGRRKSATTERQQEYDSDNTNLNNFHYLNYMELNDSPEHRHVRVLLLLCAALRKDRRTVEALVPVVTGLLANPAAAATDEEAFIMAVLFIATQNADWRTAAKLYGQTHDTLSEPLSLLMPLIKNIHFRNNKIRISKRLEAKQSRRVADTLAQISNCRPEALSPEAVSAIWDILTLPAYDTDDGRAVRTAFSKLFDVAPHEGLSQAGNGEEPEPTPKTLTQSRNRLLQAIRPSASALASYYHILVRLYPDRSTPDVADLYAEFHKLLLPAYAKAPLFSTSWWQLKALLEHYHHF